MQNTNIAFDRFINVLNDKATLLIRPTSYYGWPRLKFAVDVEPDILAKYGIYVKKSTESKNRNYYINIDILKSDNAGLGIWTTVEAELGTNHSYPECGQKKIFHPGIEEKLLKYIDAEVMPLEDMKKELPRVWKFLKQKHSAENARFMGGLLSLS